MLTHVHTCAAHPWLRACRRTGPWHNLAHGPPAGHPALPCSPGVGRGCSGGTPVPPRGQQGQGRAGAGGPLAVTCTCSVCHRCAGSARDTVLLLKAMRAGGRRRLARFRHLSPLGTMLRARGHPACPAAGLQERGSAPGSPFPKHPSLSLPAPDVLGRGREQPRQLQSTRARCAGRTLRALRRLPSPRPVLIQPRHGTGRKDIPPVGTACTHGVIPSSLRGKPQGGCSRSPSPSAARAGPKEPCWDAACATPSPAVAPIPCWLPGQELSWPEFSRLSVLGLSPAVTKPSYGRKSASEPRWMLGCLRLLPHCSLSATGTGSTEPPGMVFPSKWCRGTKLPHQPCLGDCSELC